MTDQSSSANVSSRVNACESAPSCHSTTAPEPNAAARNWPSVETAIAEKGLALLKERERQIICLVSEGLSNKEIGRRLNVTDGTIKVHLHHVYQKLNVSNRTSLAALAISQNELIDRPAETGVLASGKR